MDSTAFSSILARLHDLNLCFRGWLFISCFLFFSVLFSSLESVFRVFNHRFLPFLSLPIFFLPQFFFLCCCCLPFFFSSLCFVSILCFASENLGVLHFSWGTFILYLMLMTAARSLSHRLVCCNQSIERSIRRKMMTLNQQDRESFCVFMKRFNFCFAEAHAHRRSFLLSFCPFVEKSEYENSFLVVQDFRRW